MGAGVWGVGALRFTLMTKVAMAITVGEMRYRPSHMRYGPPDMGYIPS
jgi:hypothetical protein